MILILDFSINLSNTVLSDKQKSVLKKGHSFVKTPKDINWCKICKVFPKFTNKIRHLADLDQQQEQGQSQVNSNEPIINAKNFPPGKPPPKVNP